ncbi:MAG: M48 family metallopeptidase, partial [Gammaproteobacteria bacterium]|nr:M48 family metallopeptidase [Gammaproteobacteria bacterium]
MHLFTLLFLGMLLLSVAIELWLLQRQLGHVAARRNEVPDAFAERISLSAHQRAADYTLSKARLARYEILYGALILLGLTLGGGLQWFDQLWRSLQLTPLLGGTGFILSVVLVTSLLDLPFALYRTFRIEQRFGFNRTTLKLFFSDMLKQGLLMLLLGVPLIALVLWLMQSAGQWWWLYVWLVWSGFTLLMLWAYPAVIA